MQSWQENGYLLESSLDAILNSIPPEVLKDLVWDTDNNQFRSKTQAEKEANPSTETKDIARDRLKSNFIDNLGNTK